MQQELRTLVCIDQDQAAFAVAEPQLAAIRREGLDIRLHQGNFRRAGQHTIAYSCMIACMFGLHAALVHKAAADTTSPLHQGAKCSAWALTTCRLSSSSRKSAPCCDSPWWHCCRDMRAALQSAVGSSGGVADGILLDLGVSSMQVGADRMCSCCRLHNALQTLV